MDHENTLNPETVPGLNQILIWNQQGIIQGPCETDTDFIKRARYLEEFKEKISKSLQIEPQDQEKGRLILEEVFPKTRAFYSIEPSFVPLFFSNKQLSFLHGGSSWIVQIEKDSPTAAFIQLKKAYGTKKKVFFYSLEEILVHELAHIGRMAYNCPSFEEILAWQSSNNRFRRFFGPLFISLKETALFAFLLITLFIADIMTIIFGDESLFQSFQFFKIIPVAYLVYAGIRLFFRQRTFSLCLAKLQKLFGKERAMAIIYRLSDKEIRLFSKESEGGILAFIKTNARDKLRWNTISKAYGIETFSRM